MPLTKHLSERGYSVKVSARSREKVETLKTEGFDSYVIDIEDPNCDYSGFLDSDILVINITCKNRDAFIALMTHLTHSAIKNVLFISSTSVYRNLQRPVTEDEQAEDTDHVLFQIERLFMENKNIQATIIRMAGLIGPARHPGRFFRNGKNVKQADAPVNLIHLDDAVGIISSVLEHDAWGQTFNACADTHPTKREFYSYAASLIDLPAPEFDEQCTAAFKVVDNQKMKDKLHYQLVHPDLMKLTTI